MKIKNRASWLLCIIIVCLSICASACSDINKEIKFVFEEGNSVDISRRLPDGGSFTMSVECNSYKGSDGNEYAKLESRSYQVNNSYKFNKVSMKYNDGQRTRKKTSKSQEKEFDIETPYVLSEENTIHVILTVYMEDGKKEVFEFPR